MWQGSPRKQSADDPKSGVAQRLRQPPGKQQILNIGDAAQLAERKTKNDPGDYRAMVQEKARERFMKMG
ncbi:unnamed protein product [Clonostachys byssicola]|uniref:Uncharacterized protein n=1 Tax=Clonostachys byssicola TaxID=160290 RepID=A0A9N9Y2K1_9HYPO|nr:unnamed protein product [Clonostachys byssicola]